MSEFVMADKPTGESFDFAQDGELAEPFRSRRVHQKTFGVKKSTLSEQNCRVHLIWDHFLIYRD